MITLGINAQSTEEVPTEIAEWVQQKNTQYPNVNFTIDRWLPHETQAAEHRLAAEKHQRTFSGFAGGDPLITGVQQIAFQYGNETWWVKITGGLTEDGDVRNMFQLQDGETITKPLPATMRNEIAGIDFDTFERLDIAAKPEQGLDARVTYAEPRDSDHPLVDQPESFTKIDWEMRHTSTLSMTGNELEEAKKHPEQLQATSEILRASKKGMLH